MKFIELDTGARFYGARETGNPELFMKIYTEGTPSAKNAVRLEGAARGTTAFLHKDMLVTEQRDDDMARAHAGYLAAVLVGEAYARTFLAVLKTLAGEEFVAALEKHHLHYDDLMHNMKQVAAPTPTTVHVDEAHVHANEPNPRPYIFGEHWRLLEDRLRNDPGWMLEDDEHDPREYYTRVWNEETDLSVMVSWEGAAVHVEFIQNANGKQAGSFTVSDPSNNVLKMVADGLGLKN